MTDDPNHVISGPEHYCNLNNKAMEQDETANLAMQVRGVSRKENCNVRLNGPWRISMI